jgi:hypothetical protein
MHFVKAFEKMEYPSFAKNENEVKLEDRFHNMNLLTEINAPNSEIRK